MSNNTNNLTLSQWSQNHQAFAAPQQVRHLQQLLQHSTEQKQLDAKVQSITGKLNSGSGAFQKVHQAAAELKKQEASVENARLARDKVSATLDRVRMDSDAAKNTKIPASSRITPRPEVIQQALKIAKQFAPAELDEEGRRKLVDAQNQVELLKKAKLEADDRAMKASAAQIAAEHKIEAAKLDALKKISAVESNVRKLTTLRDEAEKTVSVVRSEAEKNIAEIKEHAKQASSATNEEAKKMISDAQKRANHEISSAKEKARMTVSEANRQAQTYKDQASEAITQAQLSKDQASKAIAEAQTYKDQAVKVTTKVQSYKDQASEAITLTSRATEIIQELEAKREQDKTKLRKRKRKYDEVSKDLEAAEITIAGLEREKGTLTNTLESTTQLLQLYNEERQDLAQDNQRYESMIHQMDKSIKGRDQLIQDKDNKIKNQDELISSQRIKLKRKTTDLAATVEDANTQLKASHEQSMGYFKQASALLERCEGLKTSMAELEGIIQEKDSALDTVKKESDRLKSQWSSSLEAKDKLLIEATLEKKRAEAGFAANFKQMKEGLTKQLQQANTEKQEWVKSAKSDASKIEAQLKTIRTLRAERGDAKRQVTSLREQLLEANNQLHTSQEYHLKLQSDHKDSLRKIQDRIDEYRKSNSDLQRDLKAKTAELESVIRAHQLHDADATHKTQSTIDALNEKCQELDTEKAQLQKRFDSWRASASERAAALEADIEDLRAAKIQSDEELSTTRASHQQEITELKDTHEIQLTHDRKAIAAHLAVGLGGQAHSSGAWAILAKIQCELNLPVPVAAVETQPWVMELRSEATPQDQRIIPSGFERTLERLSTILYYLIFEKTTDYPQVIAIISDMLPFISQCSDSFTANVIAECIICYVSELANPGSDEASMLAFGVSRLLKHTSSRFPHLLHPRGFTVENLQSKIQQHIKNCSEVMANLCSTFWEWDNDFLLHLEPAFQDKLHQDRTFSIISEDRSDWVLFVAPDSHHIRMIQKKLIAKDDSNESIHFTLYQVASTETLPSVSFVCHTRQTREWCGHFLQQGPAK